MNGPAFISPSFDEARVPIMRTELLREMEGEGGGGSPVIPTISASTASFCLHFAVKAKPVLVHVLMFVFLPILFFFLFFSTSLPSPSSPPLAPLLLPLPSPLPTDSHYSRGFNLLKLSDLQSCSLMGTRVSEE